MKRILILLMAAVFLVACSNKTATEDKEASAEEQPKEEATQEEPEQQDIEEEDESGAEETEEDESEESEPTLEEDESDAIGEDEVKELLEYFALGENDVITNLEIGNGEIKAVVELGDNEFIDDKSMLAETVYSMAGDELLQHDGWEVLTIEFVDVGEVSMNRDEKEANEYGGEYLPLEEIMRQLGNL